ncbi:MAG: hypothetical protein ACOCV2_04690 [Persicimonas sp.]
MNSIASRCLSFLALLCLLGALQGCTSLYSMYSYKEVAEEPIEGICPQGDRVDQEMLLEDECGVELTKLTAESACEAGDGLGCAVAASLILDSSSLTQSGQSTSVGTDRRAFDMASRGCDLDDEMACQLEVSMQLESNLQSSHQQAMQTMDYKCNEGMGSMCLMLGSIYEANATTPHELSMTADYYESGCEAEDADSCFRLAKLHEEGQGVSQSASRAEELYGDACDLRLEDACKEIDRDVPEADDKEVSQWHRFASESFTEMTETGCENGFPHGCTLGGRLIERGEMRSRYVDDERALELFEKGCEKGAAESCFYQARMVHDGRGVDADTSEALTLAEESCEGGYQRGCELKRDYTYRLFDEARAEEHAERCRDEETEDRSVDCYLAGQAYSHGANFDEDLDEARALHETACDLDYADACYAAAELYDPDEAEKGDPERAGELYETACELRAEDACHRLGVDYHEGTGVDRDVERAIEYLDQGCELGVAESCGTLGHIFEYGEEEYRDESRSEELLQRGCGGGYLRACSDLATLYLQQESEEGVQKGLTLLYFACSNDEPEACNSLGTILTQTGDNELHTEAADHLEKGCLMDAAPACANLGYLYLEGRGVERDGDRAVQLYQKSCDEGYARGCQQLGTMYRDGYEVEGDAERAIELFDRACEEDHGDGCQALAGMKLEGRGTEYAPDEALELIERACNDGGDTACVLASGLLTRDVHVEPSLERALEHLETGCDGDGLSSCIELSDRTRVGIGTEADAERADELADRIVDAGRKRCEADEPQLCATVAHRIAHGRGEDTDFSSARDFLREQCDEEENLLACLEIGEQRGTGELFSRDREAAYDELLELCKDQDLGPACEQAAYLMRHGYSDEIELTRSVDLYEDLCDDDPQACAKVANAYLHGLGVDPDNTRAANYFTESCNESNSWGCTGSIEAHRALDDSEELERLYEESERGCDHKSGESCARKGQMLARGISVERDFEAAQDAFDRACELRDENACALADALDEHLDSVRNSDPNRLSGQCEESSDSEKSDATACVRLGLAHEFDLVDEASAERAARHYETACDAGDDTGCQLRMTLHAFEREALVGDDYYTYADAACTESTPLYCMASGERVASHDWEEGVEMVERACAADMDEACLWLATNGESYD